MLKAEQSEPITKPLWNGAGQEATAEIGGGPQGAHGDVWQGCENDE